jgi:hypothetical protein
MRRRTQIAAPLAAALLVLAGGTAAFASPQHFTDSWQDNICGIDVEATITGTNPIVLTGKLDSSGNPVSIDTGSVKATFTNPDTSHWIQFRFAGPAKILSVVDNGDGTLTKLVQFSGDMRGYRAWDGAWYRDVGHAIVEYLVSQNGTPADDSDDYIISRTVLKDTGTRTFSLEFFDFCAFAVAKLS